MPEVKECGTLALYKAMSSVASSSHENVIFEIDSQIVVKALEHKLDYETKFGVILNECRLFLQRQSSFKVCFTMKNVNVVAYDLIRQALFVANPIIGIDSSKWLSNVLSNVWYFFIINESYFIKN